MEKLKIVVVDDELTARTNAAELLRQVPDCELVGMAENGQQALCFADELAPNVMLVDISMPGMSGLELVRRLKERHPEIQLIMLTIYSDFEFAVDSFRYGAVDYILKDAYDTKPLMHAIEKARKRLAENSAQEAAEFAYALEKQLRERKWLGRTGRFARFMKLRDSVGTLSEQYDELTRLESFAELFPVESGIWLGIGEGKRSGLPADVVESATAREATEGRLNAFKASSMEYFYFPQTARLSGEAYDGTFPREMRIRIRRQFAEFMSNDGSGFAEEFVRECAGQRIHPDEMKKLTISCLLDMDDGERLFREVIAQIQAADTSDEAILALRTAQLQWQLSVGKRERMLVSTLKKYIAEHLADELSLNVLAEQVGFSAAYVSTLFKRETGEGLKHCIMQARLEKAAELLRTTNLKIYEISEQCGFANTRYFSDLFTKSYNMTPQKYRKWG